MADQTHRVWVFFYGSNINFKVLRQGLLALGECEVARAPGFDIRITPTANLTLSDQNTVWRSM